MRRLLLVLLAFAAWAPAARANPLPRDWVDVGIALDAEEVRFAVTSEAGIEGAEGLARVKLGQSFVARVRGGRVIVQPVSDVGIHEVRDTLLVRPLDSAGRVRIGEREYRGALKLFRSPKGRVSAANRVGLEDYLRGVLPHEIGQLQQETLEAGKAQAVAARTYAVSYLGRRADEGIDVYATVEDQFYGGAKDEGPLTDRCVRETAGLVALYDGVPIRANYFSTCGGVTSNIEDVWPEPPLPWLRSVPDRPNAVTDDYCKISPQYRWTEVWEVGEFLDILNRTYSQVIAPTNRLMRVLRDVRVETRSPSGRVARLVVETDAGTFPMYGDLVRRALLRPKRARGAGGPGAILRSALFKIGVARTADGTPFAVVASGAGYGHGVGMCQMGAIAMARRGEEFRDILRHYYRDIQITDV